MNMIHRLVLISCLIILGGVWAGFFHDTSTPGGSNCGAVFLGESSSEYSGDEIDCAPTRSAPRAIAIGLFAVGGLGLAGAWIAAGRRKATAEPRPNGA
jgi:hypothetical protein